MNRLRLALLVTSFAPCGACIRIRAFKCQPGKSRHRVRLHTRAFFDNWEQHREHAIAVVRSQSS